MPKDSASIHLAAMITPGHSFSQIHMDTGQTMIKDAVLAAMTPAAYST
jgi:hypothetical protein